MALKFSDGVTIDTAGPLRHLHLTDGDYLVGNGHLIPTLNYIDTVKTGFRMAYPYITLELSTREVEEFVKSRKTTSLPQLLDILQDYIVSQGLGDVEE